MRQCIKPISLEADEVNTITGYAKNVVPCGKCFNCIRRNADEWTFRLKLELEEAETAAFTTFTYNDQNLPYSKNGLPIFDYQDHAKVMKRIRKNYDFHPRFPLKYFGVSEYGSTTQRPHFHHIFFNLPEELITPIWNDEKAIQEFPKLSRIWKKGNVTCDVVTGARIGYITGYLQKNISDRNYNPNDDRPKEKRYPSKGLGKSFLQRDNQIAWYKKHLTPYLVKEGGEKMAMPRYFKNKIYSEEDLKFVSEQAALFMCEQESPFKDGKHFGEWCQEQILKRDKQAKLKRQTI